MLKKMLLAAAAVLALTAVAVPTASATITHNHKAIEKNATETFTGEALFQSAATGQVKCTSAEGVIELLAGQTKGNVTKFSCPNATTNAHVTGAIAAICGGQTILHKAELTKNASAEIVTSPASTPAITVTNIELFNTFTNGAHSAECLKLHLKSETGKDVVVTPNAAQTIASGALSGTLTATGFGGVAVSGTLIPEKINTYGIVAV